MKKNHISVVFRILKITKTKDIDVIKCTSSECQNLSSVSKPESQMEKLQIQIKNGNRSNHIEVMRAASEFTDRPFVGDQHPHRSHSRQRQSQQRTLSSSSIENLLTNLQHIQLQPSSSPLNSYINEQEDDEDDGHNDNGDEDEDNNNGLQLLIDLGRDIESTKINKLDRLYSFVENSVGMVELRSLLCFIKSSSSTINLNEPPLNLYSPILPTLITLILLENDI